MKWEKDAQEIIEKTGKLIVASDFEFKIGTIVTNVMYMDERATQPFCVVRESNKEEWNHQNRVMNRRFARTASYYYEVTSD